MNYDFSILNDREFEDLANDLHEAEYSVRVERFKPGKDQGVDGRYFLKDHKRPIIIQAKHYQKTPIPGLLKSLQGEAQKIDKLNPLRYYLYTSSGLSPANKKKIFEIFKPYLISESDIYSINDICSLIKDHENVEKKHFKLWMKSSGIIFDLLNSGIVNRSTLLAEEIVNSERMFVRTAATSKAEDLLIRKGSVILTGEPGAGKTTLAKHLCGWSAADDYHIVDIANPEDAHKIWKRNTKQIFYFDDFLGGNYLELMSKNVDAQIFRLIDAVSKDDSKRFVLTTRSVILNTAKSSSDVFRYNKSEIYEIEVSTNEIGYIEKARMLYAHLVARVSNPIIRAAFYENKKYIEVVRHRNYNPRLIEYITDEKRFEEGRSAPDIWKQIENSLEKPDYIWDRAINHQSNPFVKLLVEIVSFSSSSLEEVKLESIFHTAVDSLSNRELRGHKSISFNETMRFALGSLVKRVLYPDGEVEIDTINPSIRDYVFSSRSDSHEFISLIVDSYSESAVFQGIVALHKKATIKKPTFSKIIINLLIRIEKYLNASLFNSKKDYIIDVLSLAIKRDFQIKAETVNRASALILECRKIDIERACDFLLLVSKSRYELSVDLEDVKNFLIRSVAKRTHKDDLVSAVNLASYHELDSDLEFWSELVKAVSEIASDILNDNKSDVLDDFESMDDLSDAKDRLYDYLKAEIIEIHPNIDFDFINDLIEDVDYEEIMIENTSSSGYDGGGRHIFDRDDSGEVSDEDIDDVFR